MQGLDQLDPLRLGIRGAAGRGVGELRFHLDLPCSVELALPLTPGPDQQLHIAGRTDDLSQSGARTVGLTETLAYHILAGHRQSARTRNMDRQGRRSPSRVSLQLAEGKGIRGD